MLIQVDSEEAAQAVEALARFLYSKALPAEASPIQLLQLLITSNEYQSSRCTEACAR